MLEESIDDLMEREGFIRKKNSLLYTKKIGTVRQKVDMYFYSHPSYQPNAIMHLYPFFSVSFPRVNEMAKKMTGYVETVIRMKNETVRQPIQLMFKSESWMLIDLEEKKAVALKISEFIKQYTIPLLAELECEEDFIKLYEKQDERVMMADVQHIFVASAYVLRGDYEKGLKVLDSRFGKLGRRKYANAFQYIENLLSGT